MCVQLYIRVCILYCIQWFTLLHFCAVWALTPAFYLVIYLDPLQIWMKCCVRFAFVNGVREIERITALTVNALDLERICIKKEHYYSFCASWFSWCDEVDSGNRKQSILVWPHVIELIFGQSLISETDMTHASHLVLNTIDVFEIFSFN